MVQLIVNLKLQLGLLLFLLCILQTVKFVNQQTIAFRVWQVIKWNSLLALLFLFLLLHSIFREHLNIFMHDAVCNYVFVRICLNIWMPKFLLSELGTMCYLYIFVVSSWILFLQLHYSLWQLENPPAKTGSGPSRKVCMYIQIQKLVLKTTEALNFIIFCILALLVCSVTVFLSLFSIRLWCPHTPLFMLIQSVMRKLAGLCLYWIIRILMYCRSTKQ
jgi:hypothetical protein